MSFTLSTAENLLNERQLQILACIVSCDEPASKQVKKELEGVFGAVRHDERVCVGHGQQALRWYKKVGQCL